MAIYERLMGEVGLGGHVVLACRECRAPAEDAKSEHVLKICSSWGMPLGEWATEAERETELRDFQELVKKHSTPPL
jgi:hypothetical protein